VYVGLIISTLIQTCLKTDRNQKKGMFNNTDLQRAYIKMGRLFPKILVKNLKHRPTFQLRRHYHGSSYDENQLLK